MTGTNNSLLCQGKISNQAEISGDFLIWLNFWGKTNTFKSSQFLFCPHPLIGIFTKSLDSDPGLVIVSDIWSTSEVKNEMMTLWSWFITSLSPNSPNCFAISHFGFMLHQAPGASPSHKSEMSFCFLNLALLKSKANFAKQNFLQIYHLSFILFWFLINFEMFQGEDGSPVPTTQVKRSSDVWI